MIKAILQTIFRLECQTWHHDAYPRKVKMRVNGKVITNNVTGYRRNIFGFKTLVKRTPFERVLYKNNSQSREEATPNIEFTYAGLKNNINNK